jgi:hypothetical protein
MESGSFAQILAVECRAVEGIKLRLLVVLARVQSVEIRNAIDTKLHCVAIDDDVLQAVLSALSTIQGKRTLQSWLERGRNRTRLSSRIRIRRSPAYLIS